MTHLATATNRKLQIVSVIECVFYQFANRFCVETHGENESQDNFQCVPVLVVGGVAHARGLPQSETLGYAEEELQPCQLLRASCKLVDVFSSYRIKMPLKLRHATLNNRFHFKYFSARVGLMHKLLLAFTRWLTSRC